MSIRTSSANLTRLSNTTLYGVLVARNAYTLVSAEVLSVRLGVEI